MKDENSRLIKEIEKLKVIIKNVKTYLYFKGDFILKQEFENINKENEKLRDELKNVLIFYL